MSVKLIFTHKLWRSCWKWFPLAHRYTSLPTHYYMSTFSW